MVFSNQIDKFKTVLISAVIRMPLERKFVTYNALLPYVLKRGSLKYNSIRNINMKTDELNGAIFDANVVKKGEEQIIQFFIEVIDDKEIVKNTIEFLSEVMLKPYVENGHFKKEYVEDEKEFLKDEIDGRKNDKKEFAKLRCIEIMCKNEPFGIYGDGYIEDLENINEKNLYQHYCNVMSQYSIEFYYVGDIDDDIFKSYVQEYFDCSTECNRKFESNIIYDKQEVKKVCEEEGLSQGRLCIGIRTDVEPNSDDFFALLVANEIFGGGASSKLFLKLREENGLCYYVNSFVYRFKTIMFVQAGIKKEDFEKSVETIKQCIEEVKNGDFEKSDFQNAVASLSKKYLSTFDYQSGIIDFNLSQNILDYKINIDDAMKKLKNVSIEDVSDVMSKVYIDTIYFLC